MVSIFFSKADSISLDVLNENQNANGTWYKEICLKNLLNQWKITHKKCGVGSIVLHHDNAKIHECKMNSKQNGAII